MPRAIHYQAIAQPIVVPPRPPATPLDTWLVPFSQPSPSRKSRLRPYDIPWQGHPGTWSSTGIGAPLRVYFTGADSDGGSQDSPSDSLGNFRANREARRVGFLQTSAMDSLEILELSRVNLPDVPSLPAESGSLVAVDADRVRYTAPNSTTPGPAVSLSGVGDIRTVPDGEDPSRWVRVARTSSEPIGGDLAIELHEQFNNVFGFNNASDAEHTTGSSKYRAVMLRNVSMARVTDIRFWIGPLAPSTSTADGGLSSSGGGTLTAPQGAFARWPKRGWARIEDAEGALREIVYYSSRTSSELTVPTLGRGLLGTWATAGDSADTIHSVPPLAIAWEPASPAVDGSVQTIADEDTAPVGLTWHTAIDPDDAIVISGLSANAQGAVWLNRQLPPGVSACSKVANLVKVRFAVQGRTYTETLAGLFRIADASLERFELHHGLNQVPDIAAPPDETFTSLPHTTTLELTEPGAHYLVINRRNQYDLASESTQATVITVDGSAEAIVQPPTPPEVMLFEPGAEGTFLLEAVYYYEIDGHESFGTEVNQADQFLIYLRTDGSDPDPGVDTPTVVEMQKASGVALLQWTSPPYAAETTAKALVLVRRSSDGADSVNDDLHIATNSVSGPVTPTGSIFYRRIAEQS